MPTVGARNPDEIVSRVKKAGDVRIFSFGIGSDVNTQLLDQIAENTRAFSQYVLASEDLEVKGLELLHADQRTGADQSAPGIQRRRAHEQNVSGRNCRTCSKAISSCLPAATPVRAKSKPSSPAWPAGREQTFTYKVKFDDRGSANDFVPRLWATRRVGFLLDEIRLHGETSELRDETTELARKYGIVTPYTAYLIVEDEDRRRVPVAQRSLQENDCGYRRARQRGQGLGRIQRQEGRR